MPQALQELSTPERLWWISTRALIASLAVPVVEELAFRGFLMRRLDGVDFDALSFTRVSIKALVISSVLFGLTHGAYWAPGIVAGLLFGAVAMRTGRFGDAVIAHAMANALLAAGVLLFGMWQLW
jgi:CAAX prenyl protease-like protein